jgi:hypothetical protein
MILVHARAHVLGTRLRVPALDAIEQLPLAVLLMDISGLSPQAASKLCSPTPKHPQATLDKRCQWDKAWGVNLTKGCTA